MLARDHRLRSGDEIREVIKSGKRVSNSLATLHFLASDSPRFAVVASKAVGNAVTRNLVRRRTKAALFQLLSGSPSISGVVRLRAEAAQLSFQQIHDLLNELLRRIK